MTPKRRVWNSSLTRGTGISGLGVQPELIRRTGPRREPAGRRPAKQAPENGKAGIPVIWPFIMKKTMTGIMIISITNGVP